MKTRRQGSTLRTVASLIKKVVCLSLMAWVVSAGPCFAQLDSTFSRIFDDFLRRGFKLSPGQHGEHFLPAADRAINELTPALNSLIAGNIASFPLSSTLSNTYDPISRTASWDRGPILAESAKTVSQGRLTLGFSYAHLDLTYYRGLLTNDIRFTFTHEDLGVPGLGDNPNESDLLDLYLNLEVDANIYAFILTYGANNRFDIGLAIPIVNVYLSGDALGVVQSFTFATGPQANHQFGADSLAPVLEKVVPYRESASGIGDLALRLKYNFIRIDKGTNKLYVAALLDFRMPTGAVRNFLGTGEPQTKVSLIVSKSIAGFTSHLNIGYERRNADFNSDELEVVLGFDHKVNQQVTIAGELIGDIDLEGSEAITLFPGTIEIVDRPHPGSQNVRTIDLSNVPEQDHDHTFALALGVRVAASKRLSLLGYVLTPLNDGGLRSPMTATIGLSVFF